MSEQKTIIANSVELLDRLVTNFKKDTGAKVFATHTDWKVFPNPAGNSANDVIQVHKVTLFYDIIGTVSEEKTEEAEAPPTGMGAENANLPSNKRPERTDFGAAWIDKKDSTMLNIKKLSGGYINIPEGDLIFNDGETYYADPDEEIKLYFVKTNSDNPKFPKYKVYK